MYVGTTCLPTFKYGWFHHCFWLITDECLPCKEDRWDLQFQAVCALRRNSPSQNLFSKQHFAKFTSTIQHVTQHMFYANTATSKSMPWPSTQHHWNDWRKNVEVDTIPIIKINWEPLVQAAEELLANISQSPPSLTPSHCNLNPELQLFSWFAKLLFLFAISSHIFIQWLVVDTEPYGTVEALRTHFIGSFGQRLLYGFTSQAGIPIFFFAFAWSHCTVGGNSDANHKLIAIGVIKQFYFKYANSWR